MPIRIAIPMPHSTDREYGERAIPQYERAVALAGGEPVRIPLDRTPAEIRTLIDRCDGVLLPGSNADIDPARFQQARSPRTAKTDPRRDDVDTLLLDDAYARRKPVLGICYGLQSLNVYRKGSLIQHIPDFLPEATRARVNHEAGKTVAVAHTVEVERSSLLAGIVRTPLASSNTAVAAYNREGHGLSPADSASQSIRALVSGGDNLVVPVNSSHHQSADAIGEGLRIVARCPADGIIEALEGTAPGHFVVAVQWHPERSVDQDGASRAIFQAMIAAASQFQT
jgi:putative glutamine amidotransferase